MTGDENPDTTRYENASTGSAASSHEVREAGMERAPAVWPPLQALMSTGYDLVEHGGCVWLKPDRFLRTWSDAMELSKSRLAGAVGWRLPTAVELANFFRSGVHSARHWPSYFYWTHTLGANDFYCLVSGRDSEIYVNDDDCGLFHVALVRSATPPAWELAD